MWRVKTPTAEIQLSAAQLVRQLSEQIARAKKADVDVLTDSLCEYLEVNRVMRRMKVEDYLHLGVMMGYFYKQFLENNRVTLEQPDEVPSLDGSSSSTSHRPESRTSGSE